MSQNNILVTFKQNINLTPRYSFSLLAEIDWNTQQFLRTIKFPTASYRDNNAFMSSILCGICNIGHRIFVAMWNAIIEIDYETFEIVDTFSHPFMTDVHGLSTDGQHLYVASTGIDAVLCFDSHTFDLVWRWGPDEPILYSERIEQILASKFGSNLPVINRFLRRKLYQKQQFITQEYRYRHKSVTEYHHHHLNDLHFDDGVLYITTKQWNNTQAGAIISLDIATQQSAFFVSPDSLSGLHDYVPFNDRIYVTESGANGVAWINSDGSIVHHRLEPSPYFIRGLCRWGENFLVGFSTERNTNHPAYIMEYSTNFSSLIKQMDVSMILPLPEYTAIHTILQSPID